MLLTPEMAALVKGKSVLIVDDEDGIRQVLSSIFRACGAITSEANNGKTAFEMIERESVDLIISDIRMPEGDGVDFLANVRSKHGKCPPFIFISGCSEYTESMVIERGAQAMLAKPFGTKDVIRIAVQAIEETGCQKVVPYPEGTVC